MIRAKHKIYPVWLQWEGEEGNFEQAKQSILKDIELNGFSHYTIYEDITDETTPNQQYWDKEDENDENASNSDTKSNDDTKTKKSSKSTKSDKSTKSNPRTVEEVYPKGHPLEGQKYKQEERPKNTKKKSTSKISVKMDKGGFDKFKDFKPDTKTKDKEVTEKTNS